MTTAWADLPNAKHIARLLDDLKKNPDNWSDAGYDARNATKNDARNAAWNAARTAARTAARDDAWNVAWNAVRNAASDTASDATWDAERYAAWNAASADARTVARGAILALIAYDDCAYLLDEKPEHVQMLGLLGNQAALLLYPACVAMQKEINEI